jgi:hypothetical protein
MFIFTFLVALAFTCFATTAQQMNNSTTAPVVESNPVRVNFQAVLQLDKPVQGQITGVSNQNGTGVNFKVNFFSFPDISMGPFSKYNKGSGGLFSDRKTSFELTVGG